MIYIATRATAQGRSAGMASLLGIYTGALVHIVAATLGLSALIAASASALSVVKYAGAAYLIYLGLQTLRSKAETLRVSSEEHAKLGKLFCQGFIVNLLNPKVILFFLALLPQFLKPSRGNVTLQLVFLSVVFIIVTLPVNLAVCLAGSQLGAWFQRKQGLQQASKWVTGPIYLALGVTTALTGTRKFW